ncbi:nucleotidyltransferase domain-containing protein [Desulfococcus sp.]|uniref:nucleotidyltransferase family protein n=1 Tax=Desulfococcus sp. TaxID=2025834 RepID=UPI003593B973
MPRIVTSILRVLDQHQLLGRHLLVIGTNALYGYEAKAAAFLARGLLATRDMDVLWDVRPRLRLFAADPIDGSGLIDILKKADRSFDLSGRESFRAVNRSGYMVDLVKPEPKSVFQKEERQMGGGDDLFAAEIKNLQWLVSAPKFSQVVIGDDGFPATLAAPDPRAFAIHKLWLSKQVDREPAKKKRDYSQALAVCRLILQYLPQYPFTPEELRMFPRDVVTDAFRAFKNQDLPPGYGGSSV